MKNSMPSYISSPGFSSYQADFYLHAITEFVRTACASALDLHTQDPMSRYIRSTMKNPEIRSLALSGPLGNRVYTDTLMLFVSQYLQKIKFHEQRTKHEQEQIKEAAFWSEEKRKQEWDTVLQRLQSKYEAQGFRAHFYQQERTATTAPDALWNSLLREWQSHKDYALLLQKEHYLQTNQNRQNQILLQNLSATLEYVQQKQLSSEDVFQTLALMGGRWNSVEFERLLRITHLQRKYPILIQISQKMGRTADPDGNLRLKSAMGQRTLTHSQSKNDITGIGTGRDLDSLLPLEMACFGDTELHDIFLKKYASGRLQTFDHKSQILKSARSLRSQSARRNGPMVICADTSGSMMGEPHQITLSLLMRLSELCAQQDRACFLITFSILAQPIDIRIHRDKLMQFFTCQATGNTDARRMIDALNDVLQKRAEFTTADVLWISDFRIPFPPHSSLQILEQLRQTGVCFYGLQIGIAENHWTSFFDRIYQLEEVKLSIV